MQKGRGLAAGAARAHRGWEMLETFVEVTKERNEGVWRGFCRGVRAGMSVLFSRVRAFQVAPRRGVWSVEQLQVHPWGGWGSLNKQATSNRRNTSAGTCFLASYF